MACRYHVMAGFAGFFDRLAAPWHLQVWHLQVLRSCRPDQRPTGLATASRGSASGLK